MDFGWYANERLGWYFQPEELPRGRSSYGNTAFDGAVPSRFFFVGVACLVESRGCGAPRYWALAGKPSARISALVKIKTLRASLGRAIMPLFGRTLRRAVLRSSMAVAPLLL